jgi:NADPH-dependent F420 reductase
MKDQLPTIAILGGTGKEGPGLALRWAYAGYRIVIGSRQSEKAWQAAELINHQLGIDTVCGLENHEAVKKGDICILTVNQLAHREIVESLKDQLDGKILVDATSRVDYRDPRPSEPPSAAQLSQQLLGSAVRVVAAFQNVPANSLYKMIDQPLDADVLVCSDDLLAAEEVVRLAQAAGMRGYYAGRLVNSIVVEGLTSVMISLNQYYKSKNASVRIVGISTQER